MLLPNSARDAASAGSSAGFAGQACSSGGFAGATMLGGGTEEHAVRRATRVGRGAKPPFEYQRTSSVSRRPSPTRLMASTVSARKRPGKRMIQNASCTYVLPSAMILPHDGMWGGVPAPRNDR